MVKGARTHMPPLMPCRRRPHPGRVGYSLLMCLACLAGLAACALPGVSTGPDPHIRVLQRLGAYQLRYPGSTLLHTDASPRQQGLGHVNGAQVFETFGIHTPVPATDTPTAILKWYADQLQGQGWTALNTPSDVQFQVEGNWENGGDLAIMGIYAPDQIRTYEPTVDTAAYPLVFQLHIVEIHVTT